MWLKEKLLRQFTFGHSRSINLKINIAAAFLIKGTSILVSLMLVPMTIGYVNTTNYGIWLTLSSIIGWLSFFDIGLGNGLRNKFAEVKAKGKTELARVYISSTYAMLSIILSAGVIIFIGLFWFIDWTKVLNTPPEMSSDIDKLVFIVFICFCLQMVLKLINTIFIADQKPAVASFFILFENIFILTGIYILTNTTHGSILYLGIILALVPVVVSLITNVIAYNTNYRHYRPGLKYVDLKKAGTIINLGFKFFVIQISVVVLFQTNNMIIAQLFGPAEVTTYNVSFKYFSAILMVYNIIITPFWSAFSDAYFRDDIIWIKNSMKKLMQIWYVLILILFLMYIFADKVYKIWVGDEISIPHSITLANAIYILLLSWLTIFVQFINGTGKIYLQLVHSIFVALINIPLAISLANTMNLGISGIIYANCICFLIGGIWVPIQYYKLVNKVEKGIWAK